VPVHQEQPVHPHDHLDSSGIVAIHLDGVNKFTSGMRPAAYVHQFRPADVLVGLIPVGL
jgi:hypothetical protein